MTKASAALLRMLVVATLALIVLAWAGVYISRRMTDRANQAEYSAAVARVTREAEQRAAEQITTMGIVRTNCSTYDWGTHSVDVDGTPQHARLVLWTRLKCEPVSATDPGFITLNGKLPTLDVPGR